MGGGARGCERGRGFRPEECGGKRGRDLWSWRPVGPQLQRRPGRAVLVCLRWIRPRPLPDQRCPRLRHRWVMADLRVKCCLKLSFSCSFSMLCFFSLFSYASDLPIFIGCLRRDFSYASDLDAIVGRFVKRFEFVPLVN